MSYTKTMYRRRSKKGVAISLVLFFSVVIVMYVSAALSLAPSSLGRTAADYGQLAADQASSSGIDWARARISEDPNWNALAPRTYTLGDLWVQEGDGQVTGWVRQNQGWARFRIRFNYQDGPKSADPKSDNLDDPATAWDDFPYVSSNNLTSNSVRIAPLAKGSSGQPSTSSFWTVKQLDVPAHSLLLSVEGDSGSSLVMSGSYPSAFSGTFQRRTVQTVLKFGTNQPISEAAIMSAGDLDVQLFSGSKLMLSAVNSVARLRSKDHLSFNTGVQSNNGDLRYYVTPTPAVVTGGTVSTGADGTGDGFFRIPANKVRTPSGGVSLDAGVYVVDSNGQITHYNMNYKDFVTASPAPSGTPTTLPAGMTLSTPNAPPTPRYQIKLTQDLTINAVSGVQDFALLPNGGADQSAAYAGAPSSSPAPSATPPTAGQLTSYLFSPTKPNFGGATGYAAWQTWAAAQSSAQNPSPYYGTGWTSYSLGGSATLELPNTYPNSLPNGDYPWVQWNTAADTRTSSLNYLAANLSANPAAMSALSSAFPLTGSPSPSASPSSSATPALKPKDLELDMQGGGSGGLTVSSKGSIVLGSQVNGNGAALVADQDIALVGTSTELSSKPGTQLGLNLYAKNTITIDTFKLDSSGSSEFRGINLAGVLYAWKGVNIYAGNSTVSAPLTLKGTIVAYGGDPAAAPTPGSAKTNIRASIANIQYDPSLAVSLFGSGPFTLQTVSWHQF